jgi:hypothetical protein
MNVQEFAKMLDRRECNYEITPSEEIDAMQLGFVIIFGYSDDNAELRGAIRDEIGCYGGGIIYFDENGLLRNECDDDDCPYFERLKQQCKTVEAVWDSEGYLWVYKTDIPHVIFDIFEDGEKYCRGIVFRMEDLKQ